MEKRQYEIHPAYFSKFKCEIQKEAQDDRIGPYKQPTHLHFFFFDFILCLIIFRDSITSSLKYQFENKYTSNTLPSITSSRSDSWVFRQTYSLLVFYFCKLLKCKPTHNIFTKDRVKKGCSFHKAQSETFLNLLIFTKIEMHKSPKNLQFTNNRLNYLIFLKDITMYQQLHCCPHPHLKCIISLDQLGPTQSSKTLQSASTLDDHHIPFIFQLFSFIINSIFIVSESLTRETFQLDEHSSKINEDSKQKERQQLNKVFLISRSKIVCQFQ